MQQAFSFDSDGLKLAGAALVLVGLVVMRRAPKQPHDKPAAVETAESATAPVKPVGPGRVSEAVAAGE